MRMTWLAGAACLIAAASAGGAAAQPVRDTGQVCLVEALRIQQRATARADYSIDRAVSIHQEEEARAISGCAPGDALHYADARGAGSVAARFCDLERPVEVIRYSAREGDVSVVCTYRGSPRTMRGPRS